MELCACVTNHRGDFGKRVSEIWDELKELSSVETLNEFWDEMSDVIFGLGRLLGYFCGKNYVSLWGDERHIKKIEKRMKDHGCVRSESHLVNGKCCSL